jgi:hypothetical protein
MRKSTSLELVMLAWVLLAGIAIGVGLGVLMTERRPALISRPQVEDLVWRAKTVSGPEPLWAKN